MHRLFHVFTFGCLLVGCAGADPDSLFRLPAWWQQHLALIVAFNNDPWLDSVSAEVACHISQEIPVCCLIMGDSLRAGYVQRFLARSIETARIDFIIYAGATVFSARLCCLSHVPWRRPCHRGFRVIYFRSRNFLVITKSPPCIR